MHKLLVTMLACLATIPVMAAEITAAVASNFSGAMNALVTEFERVSEHEVNIVFGSSGRFYAQISNGAPFHVFFSADQAKPLNLEQDGLAVAGSRFTYAQGGLVLWSSIAGFVDAEGAVLLDGNFDRLVMANPTLAPYGAAAFEVLQNLDLLSAAQGKIIRGANIAQAYQFVFSGNANLGFVALSQVAVDGEITRGSGWIVPTHLYNPIRQDAVLLKTAESNQAATEFLQFVHSNGAKSIIESFGYRTEQD